MQDDVRRPDSGHREISGFPSREKAAVVKSVSDDPVRNLDKLFPFIPLSPLLDTSFEFIAGTQTARAARPIFSAERGPFIYFFYSER